MKNVTGFRARAVEPSHKEGGRGAQEVTGGGTTYYEIAVKKKKGQGVLPSRKKL